MLYTRNFFKLYISTNSLNIWLLIIPRICRFGHELSISKNAQYLNTDFEIDIGAGLMPLTTG